MKMKLELPELVSVGIYNTDVAVRAGGETRSRRTAMFEIEIPIERGGTSYIDSDERPITPDLLICAKPGQTRHTRLPFKCYYIHAIVKEGRIYDELMAMPDYIKVENGDEYRALFSEMCGCYDRGLGGDDIMLSSLFLKLLHSMIGDKARSIRHTSGGSTKSAMIERALEYVGNNLAAPLSLELVSAHVGFSPIYFHYSFKTSVGKTLHEYVEQERIRAAAELLVTTSHTLSTIAYECGFSSQSYFNFAFKRKMGKTPREYAREMQKMYDLNTREGSEKDQNSAKD